MNTTLCFNLFFKKPKKSKKQNGVDKSSSGELDKNEVCYITGTHCASNHI